MSQHEVLRLRSDYNQLVPRGLLYAVSGLVLCSLLIVVFAVATGREPVARPHTAAEVQSRMIEIKARPDGGTVVSAMDGTILFDRPSNDRGFITVVRNALSFERKTHGIAGNPPVYLIRFADGRIGLRDDATGWKINLIGFGQDNARHWNELLQ
ncbi:MAG: photosynthetic complex assembly protein PuhC [Pseudomonadota bacterium]